IKRTLFAALALASLSTAVLAEAKPAVAQASSGVIQALRNDCAASHAVKREAQPQAANEYSFVYYNGELRGEVTPGQALDCSESQSAAYLNKADPAGVMSAYPTAAGPPVEAGSKPAAK